MAAASTCEDQLGKNFNETYIYRGIRLGKVIPLHIVQRCEKFQFRPDDIVVCTYPRSGTTLTQEIVWQIVNHEKVEKGGQYGSQFDRFSFMEMDLKSLGMSEENPIDTLEAQTTQRLIKTHLPYSFIRQQIEKVNPKVIIVMRNPKDNVVSCFNFFKGMQDLREDVSFKDYFDLYTSGQNLCGDYFDSNLEWWSLRNRENVLIVRYEDIVHQPFQQVRAIAAFLDFSLSAEKLEAILHNTKFDSMKENADVNLPLVSGEKTFLRKGKSGDWKTWLTVAQNEAMDTLIKERLSPEGLHFTFD